MIRAGTRTFHESIGSTSAGSASICCVFTGRAAGFTSGARTILHEVLAISTVIVACVNDESVSFGSTCCASAGEIIAVCATSTTSFTCASVCYVLGIGASYGHNAVTSLVNHIGRQTTALVVCCVIGEVF